jgi:hypothetical protein
MKILRITTAALAAATAIGVSGAALAGPAANLSTGAQAAQRDDNGAVQQAYHRHHHYGYYYSPYYYRPYYRPYYYSPYYYGYGPSFNFGIHIR